MQITYILRSDEEKSDSHFWPFYSDAGRNSWVEREIRAAKFDRTTFCAITFFCRLQRSVINFHFLHKRFQYRTNSEVLVSALGPLSRRYRAISCELCGLHVADLHHLSSLTKTTKTDDYAMSRVRVWSDRTVQRYFPSNYKKQLEVWNFSTPPCIIIIIVVVD